MEELDLTSCTSFCLNRWEKGGKILNNGSPTSHFAVSRLSRQALCRRQMGDFDGAIKACEEGLTHYTTSASEPMK